MRYLEKGLQVKLFAIVATILFSLSFGASLYSIDVFYPNVRVSDDNEGWYQNMPSLAISPNGDTLYCVFIDSRYGYHDFPGLTLAKSSDGGKTWSENLLIYYGEWDAEVAPNIAVDSQGWLHVVFGFVSPGGVWYTKSTDGGNNWTSPVMISDTMYLLQNPISIAIDSNDNLYVMWYYYYEGVSDGYDIFFTKSTDNGTTWLHPNVIVNDTVSCMNLSPSFCLGGLDTIYTVWDDDRLPSWHVFFSRSTDGGLSWLSTNIKVDPDTISSYNPKIIYNKLNGFLYCTWQWFNADLILFSKSADNGETWSSPITVSDSLEQSLGLHSFDIDSSGNMYLTWQDARQDSSDIFFTFSTDDGNIWYFPNIKVNDDTTQRPQSYADILVKGQDDVYVVWEDPRNDTMLLNDADIYFARGSIISGIKEMNSANKSEKIDFRISPNPFTATTHISITLTCKGFSAKGIELKIYDLTGRLVKSFPLTTDHSSLYTAVSWDGRDESGVQVTAGVYFVVLKSLNYKTIQKVVLLQ